METGVGAGAAAAAPAAVDSGDHFVLTISYALRPRRPPGLGIVKTLDQRFPAMEVHNGRNLW
jgi:hypothetical protein